MAGAVKDFRDLECWRKCRELRLLVAREVIAQLPAEERFRLKDQMLRAARSTTANIAEGFGRFHALDNAKFCCNARGSCYELIDHLVAAHDEGFVSEALLIQSESMARQAVNLLSGYIAYLRRSAKEER